MEIRPILSALMRSKAAMILIGLQVALTLAIVCNALFIISERLHRMNRPSGMNEADTFVIGSSGFGEGFDVKNSIDADLNLLRRLPGVVDATENNGMVPMGTSGWGSGLNLAPDQKTETVATAFYMFDDHGINSYGLNLIAGRDFKPDEVSFMTLNDRKTSPVVIITRAIAEKIFPDQNAVGKQVYDEKEPATVIGVVDRLQQPWVDDASGIEYSVIWPTHIAYGNSVRYVVRAEPGRRDEVMKLAEEKLAESDHNRIVRGIHTMQSIRATAYATDRAMAIILGSVIIALLTITALGVVGMASFWVAQRTRQIGTRRALGATRGAILRYFLTENFLITTCGLIVGGVLAYGLSLWLLAHTDGAKLLPWYYVPLGFLCLWLLGQIAVLGPATRAARVPPATATRSV